jgi:2-polyprenyl-3-methyl-5-hydroxy-6-metoxy-1,4-benzoquinol methylase
MGCGAGHLARLLADQGVEHYTGFDFSAKRLEQARLVVPEFRFEIADAYTTDLFETVDYTIVVCTEFLEHLEGDLEILGRIHSGTRVLGTVPNYDAKAHLRYFHSQTEVDDRYGPLFTDLDVAQIRNVGGGSEWLIDGTLR